MKSKDMIMDELLKQVPLETGVIKRLKVSELAKVLPLNVGAITVGIRALERDGKIKVLNNLGPQGRDVEVVEVARGVTKTSYEKAVAPATMKQPYIPMPHILTKDEHKEAAAQAAAETKDTHRRDVIANARALLYASDNFTSELMKQVMALRLSLEEVLAEFDTKK